MNLFAIRRPLGALSATLVLLGFADIPSAATEAPPSGLLAVAFANFHGFHSECGSAGPYTPEKACRMGVHGVAVIDCRVDRDGTLGACSVVSETPTAFSFGVAALRMAERRDGHRSSCAFLGALYRAAPLVPMIADRLDALVTADAQINSRGGSGTRKV